MMAVLISVQDQVITTEKYQVASVGCWRVTIMDTMRRTDVLFLVSWKNSCWERCEYLHNGTMEISVSGFSFQARDHDEYSQHPKA